MSEPQPALFTSGSSNNDNYLEKKIHSKWVPNSPLNKVGPTKNASNTNYVKENKLCKLYGDRNLKFKKS